jgi:hypothetical protein
VNARPSYSRYPNAGGPTVTSVVDRRADFAIIGPASAETARIGACVVMQIDQQALVFLLAVAASTRRYGATCHGRR